MIIKIYYIKFDDIRYKNHYGRLYQRITKFKKFVKKTGKKEGKKAFMMNNILVCVE